MSPVHSVDLCSRTECFSSDFLQCLSLHETSPRKMNCGYIAEVYEDVSIFLVDGATFAGNGAPAEIIDMSTSFEALQVASSSASMQPSAQHGQSSSHRNTESAEQGDFTAHAAATKVTVPQTRTEFSLFLCFIYLHVLYCTPLQYFHCILKLS